MAALLISQVLGPLQQDKRFADWWQGMQPTVIPFFDGLPLPVILLEVPAQPVEAAHWVTAADAALARFLALGPAVRHEATPLIMANYEQMLDLTDIDSLAIADPSDIWHFVYPKTVLVAQAYVPRGPEWQAEDMYVQVECDCEWENEHGLLLVFREGRMLTRVSEQDGHLTEGRAYGWPEEADPLMMKYYAAFGRPTNF